MANDYQRSSTLLRQRIEAQVSPETAQKILKAVTAAEMETLGTYPPNHPVANRPPGRNGRWYERGFGTRTTSGRSYPTSENFKNRWNETQHGSYRRDLDNNASYGGYIMGKPQVAWAKARGWKNIKDELKKNGPDYLELARRVVERVNRGR